MGPERGDTPAGDTYIINSWGMGIGTGLHILDHHGAWHIADAVQSWKRR